MVDDTVDIYTRACVPVSAGAHYANTQVYARVPNKFVIDNVTEIRALIAH